MPSLNSTAPCAPHCPPHFQPAPPPQAAYYQHEVVKDGEVLDAYSSVFMRMTISNIRQRSPLLWCVRGHAWVGACVRGWVGGREWRCRDRGWGRRGLHAVTNAAGTGC